MSSNAFMTPVAQSGQGDFVKIARATWMPSVNGVSLKLTFKRSSGETYSQYLTPVYGATGVALFTKAAPITQFALLFDSYSCQTGVLGIKFISPDSSTPVAFTIPGLTSQTIAPGTVASFTLPSDQKIGGTYTGTAAQGSKQISISFTTSCTLATPRPRLLLPIRYQRQLSFTTE